MVLVVLVLIFVLVSIGIGTGSIGISINMKTDNQSLIICERNRTRELQKNLQQFQILRPRKFFDRPLRQTVCSAK